MISAGHRWCDIPEYTLPQMQLFARQALRQQTLGTIRMAQAIGVAFGGKETFQQLLQELE